MKSYYLYLTKRLVANIEAACIEEATARAKALGMVFGTHYDAITTVYQPEPRTAGEVLDDTIDLTRRTAKTAIPTVRTKLGRFFSGLGKTLTPTSLPPMAS